MKKLVEKLSELKKKLSFVLLQLAIASSYAINR